MMPEMFKQWIAVCTMDNGNTTFEYEITAPSYTDALIKCYIMLERRRPGFQHAHAVLNLREKLVV